MYIRILAFLLLFLSFIACRPEPANILPVTASIAISSDDSGKPDTGNTRSDAGNVILKSADGGKSWQNAGEGLPSGVEIEGVFASGSDIFLGSSNGIYRSNSSATAPKWEFMPLLFGRITDVSTGRAGLYACSYEYGVFQNLPGTDIWKAMKMRDNAVRTVFETGDGTIFAGSDSGIDKSTDGGKTWKQVVDGEMVLNIVESHGVLIAGGTMGVLRSTDGGEHWDTVLFENIMSKNTKLVGDHFVTVLGTENPFKLTPEGVTNRLRVSDDGGKTWHRMEQSLLPVEDAYAMDEDLSQTLDIYDIVQSGEFLFCSFNTGIYRSSDQGKTWELVLDSKGKTSYNLSVSGKVIYAVPGGGC